MFLHYDALHLAVNVGFMLAFASVVERRLGKLAFLALFLAGGIAGALRRSEELRGGKVGVSTGSSRRSRDQQKKKTSIAVCLIHNKLTTNEYYIKNESSR